MSPSPPSLAGKKVLVMGLGRFGGGVAVSQWLVQQGAHVTVTDTDPPEKLTTSLHQLAGLPITFQLGGHRLEDFLAADLLIINPAVDKPKSPLLQQALARGIPYTTEINLFLQRNPALTIAVTGSVGKSTTTTLIYEALKAALTPQLPVASGQWSEGKTAPPPPTDHWPLTTLPSVFLGGNIGKSLLLDLPHIRPTDLVVLELSSFMLEDTPQICWSPNIALITNLFPNHLDRHDTLPAYAAAKQNILQFQTPADTAILNRDHPDIANWAPLVKGHLAWFTTHNTPPLPLLIPGEHNQSNAQAALAVLDTLQSQNLPLNRPAALHALTHFPGLAHRLQLVHTLTTPDGRQLRFFNDSKATTPEASLTALQAFPPKTALFIVGGYDKHIDMSQFTTLLARRAAAVIGIGQTGQSLITHLQQSPNPLPETHLLYAATLEAALPLAHQLALTTPPITAIVLSPASASYGQFTNYEHRGQSFTTLARAL